MDVLSRMRSAPAQKTAIVHGEEKITYQDLLDRSESLSRKYIAKNLGPGRAVAVEHSRGIDCVIAWLAAWISEGAFVAIDPSLPGARKEQYRNYCYLLDDKEIQGFELDHRVDYVFLSSGSSGEPKAIMMPRTGILPVIEEQIERFRIDGNSRVLWMLSPGFDASLSDVFTALCSGATLVIADSFSDVNAFYDLICGAKLTHMDIPPSLLAKLERRYLPDSLETIIVGGEVCAAAILENYAGDFHLVNCYGPTETTICSSMKIFSVDDDPRNIGEPLEGFLYSIRHGELWIHGPGVAISYGGNIEADRFVIEDKLRWFRTGDRVEKRDGDYIFLGRLDRQFKMNGQLVNPEEIEKTILENTDVRECRVEKISEKLIAFCVSKNDAEAKGILADLRHALPAWMIPRLVFVDEIPRNERGKITFDTFKNENRSGCVFVETMSEMLGYKVDQHDDFWKVGGDSLLAFDLIQALSKKGHYLSVETLRVHGSPFLLRQIGLSIGINRESILDTAADFPHRIIPPSNSKPEVILLTGATGFLGQRVLNFLLDTDYEVICIVRAENDVHAKTRLGLDDVEVFSGDLLLPHWGLPASVFRTLAERCNTVLHLAADLNLSKTYAPDRVFTVLNTMADFFEKGRPKKMIFASTLSVFASTDFSGKAEESNVDYAGVHNVYGGYTAEKMLAETIVRRCFPDATILRYGLLTGDSRDGRFHQNNALVSVIRMIIELKKSVRSKNWSFDLTPVDYAAEATVKLLNESGTFHIANCSPPSLDVLTAAIEKVREFRLDIVDSQNFLSSLRACHSENAKLARVAMARLNSNQVYEVLRSGDLFLATDIDFDGRQTQAWLVSQGCERKASNEELLALYVAWATKGE